MKYSGTIDFSTKNDYRKLLLNLLQPLIPRYSKDFARLKIEGGGAVYGNTTIEMEAFARPLWGLVPFWIGGGHDAVFEKIYIKGIENGTNPEHPEFWGHCDDDDQKFVEMAPIAFGILAAPQILWDNYSEKTKNNISRWLNEINHHTMPICNWYFFRVLVNVALKKRGYPFSQEMLDSDIKTIEQWYCGDGWYIDGKSKRFDYYSAFALQFYSILLSTFAPDILDVKKIKERAELFASDYIHYFAKDGSAIAYGRSLTYRFAQSAFWSAYTFIGEQYNAEVVKGIIARNLRAFLQSDIFNFDGLLTIGYGYPNLTMAERYNAPGSPYWALKTFLILALPDSNSFWTCSEAELELKDGIHRIERPGFVVQRSNGIPSLYTNGMYKMRSLGHFTDKYDKFVYSSKCGFCVARTNETIEESSPDNMLAFVIDGYVYVRTGSIKSEVDESHMYSEWSVPGIRIGTTITFTKNGHVRHHRIESSVDCVAYDCGYSIDSGIPVSSTKDSNKIILENSSVFSTAEGAGNVERIEADPNANLLFKNATFPAIVYNIKKGITELCDTFEFCIQKG